MSAIERVKQARKVAREKFFLTFTSNARRFFILSLRVFPVAWQWMKNMKIS
jgi:hypothetical protein